MKLQKLFNIQRKITLIWQLFNDFSDFDGQIRYFRQKKFNDLKKVTIKIEMYQIGKLTLKETETSLMMLKSIFIKAR